MARDFNDRTDGFTEAQNRLYGVPDQSFYGTMGYTRTHPDLIPQDPNTGRNSTNNNASDLFEENGVVYKRIGDPTQFDNKWSPPELKNKIINHPSAGLIMALPDYLKHVQSAPNTESFLDKIIPYIGAGAMGGLSIGSAIGSAGWTGNLADLAGAEGVAGGAGAGALPDSYWRMLADSGAITNDATPAAAGAVGTAGSPYSLATPGAGVGGVGSGGLTIPSAAGAGEFALTGPGSGAGIGGVGTAGLTIPTTAGAGGSGSSLLSRLLGGNFSALGAGTSLLSGLLSAGASRSAANTAANASNAATNAQLGMFNTVNAQQAPYREAGYSSLASLLGGFGLAPPSGGVGSGQFTHQFDANDLKTSLAPNYKFMLDQGLGATTNAANLNGGIGGNTLKAVNDYAQNYAGNAYQNAFNNYQSQQTNIFNRLSNIAGLGQTATSNTGNVAASISPGVANTMVGAGQAQAAGTVGAANALSGAANNAFGWYSLPQILGYTGSANA